MNTTSLSRCEAHISLTKLLENISTAILVVNNSGSITCANPAAENMLSMSARRIEETNINELFSGSTELLSAIEQGKESDFTLTKREVELVVPNNLKLMKVDCAITPIADESLMVVEINQIDSKLRIAKEETLAAQQNVLKILVRGFAHEVKNPLGGIRGAAQLLENELPYEDLKEYTQVIIGEVDRLQKLVDDMLGPNRPLRKTSVNIHKVLERVRQLVIAEADSGLQIERDYDPSLPEISADQDQLIQAFLNVVRNAKQAMNGNGKISLKTRSRRHVNIARNNYKLVLSVEIIDNGPGVPEEMIDKIFYPMVTGRAEGTGLGLSIAQNLIGQHSGTIECSSEPSNTVFTILLPFNIETNKI